MFHMTCESKHTPEEQHACMQPNAKMFIDNSFVKVQHNENETMEKAVEATMETVERYMKVNKLALNSDVGL